MQLAFRRLTADSPEIGRVICLATAGSVYHVEVGFDDGRWFSSRGMFNPVGVSFIIALPNDDASHWIKVPVPWPETPNLLAWCAGQVGREYDYAAAMSSAADIPIRNPEKWFCSELVSEVLSRAGWTDAPAMPNPKVLYLAVCAKLAIVPEAVHISLAHAAPNSQYSQSLGLLIPRFVT